MTILVLFAVTALILSKKCVLIGAKIVVRQERGRAGRSDGGANFCLITIHPFDPPPFQQKIMWTPLGGSPNWELGIIISRVANPDEDCPDPIHEANPDLYPTLEKKPVYGSDQISPFFLSLILNDKNFRKKVTIIDKILLILIEKKEKFWIQVQINPFG